MESLPNNLRPCLCCGENMRGRSDKKFCNDYCRNTFHYQERSKDRNSCLRKVNNTLLKNYRILESLINNENGPVRISRENMLRLGFHFDYFTQCHTNKNGQTYYYCYSYGYLALTTELYLIVKHKDPCRGL